MLRLLSSRKKVRAKTKEDKISFSQLIQALIISKEDQENVVLMGVTTKTGQNPKVRRKLNVITMKSKNA